MPKPGDRIIIEGSKLGQIRREGQLLETVGTLMKIRWADGSESLLTPGAGTFTVVPGRGGGGAKKAPKAAAKPSKAKGSKPKGSAKKKR